MFRSRIFITNESPLPCLIDNNIDLFFLKKAIQHSPDYRTRYALILHNKLFDSGGSLFLKFFRCDALFVVDGRAKVCAEFYWKAAVDR